MPPAKPSVGRIVHFVTPLGQHRPAIIVRVWDELPNVDVGIQLQVFTDGTNDASVFDECRAPIPTYVDGQQVYSAFVAPGTVWRTSVHFAEAGLNQPYTWHWPERVEE